MVRHKIIAGTSDDQEAWDIYEWSDRWVSARKT